MKNLQIKLLQENKKKLLTLSYLDTDRFVNFVNNIIILLLNIKNKELFG